MLPLDILRHEFPATQDAIYMDVANQGLISRTTRRSISRHLENRLHGRNDEESMLRHVERTRARFGQLIGASPDEIAVTKNTSDGINIIANAIRWEAGDNVVLCPKLEHANNVLPWLQAQSRHDVEIRLVEPIDGALPVEAVARAIDAHTRVVALSTVSMVPGFRAALQPIADVCRNHDAFLLADGTQSVGILDTDVEALGLDGLAVATVKGLLGLYGSGFLYCRREWAERLTPAYLSRFSVDLGDAPESAAVSQSVRLRDGALRFDTGHYNFPGMLAAYASMGQLLEIGTQAIDDHVTSLAARLASGLVELGLPVCGGAPGPGTGSIVAVGDLATLSGADVDPAVEPLHNYLQDNGVIVSTRRGMLRISLHLYNSADEVERVIELARSWQEQC